MTERVSSVTAYTTLDFVDAEAIGHEWRDSTSGVVNVSSPTEPTATDPVELQVELDIVGSDHLPTHADRVNLTPDQARTVAAELLDAADRIDEADGDEPVDADEDDPTGR